MVIMLSWNGFREVFIQLYGQSECCSVCFNACSIQFVTLGCCPPFNLTNILKKMQGMLCMRFSSFILLQQLNKRQVKLSRCWPMSRKPLITIIVYCVLGFVYTYDAVLPFLSFVWAEHWWGGWGWSIVCFSVHPVPSTFWLSSWANDSVSAVRVFVSVRTCLTWLTWLSMLVSSSSVPLMVHSEVVQWWTVKYSVFFLSLPHSGTQGQGNNRWTKGI